MHLWKVGNYLKEAIVGRQHPSFRASARAYMWASASGGKRGQRQYLMEVGIFETLTEVREGIRRIYYGKRLKVCCLKQQYI